LYIYEKTASEFHGIVNMPIVKIFEGLKLMEEPADRIWTDGVVAVFGHEFFLPVIDKNYGHLFVNDTKRHE
jgi:hypothetical protein